MGSEADQRTIAELRAQVAAMKLRALAAHDAIWRAMNGRPSDAIRALADDGEVHEAVHAIIAVDTESVSTPDEWRAHVERQDRRIDDLEARRRDLQAEADRWREVAQKLAARHPSPAAVRQAREVAAEVTTRGMFAEETYGEARERPYRQTHGEHNAALRARREGAEAMRERAAAYCAEQARAIESEDALAAYALRTASKRIEDMPLTDDERREAPRR